MALESCPVDFKECCEFVNRYHRHHIAPQGWKFGIGVSVGDKLVGVIMVGRPIARHADDGWTLEVTRCCTDGTKNASSFLYSRAWVAVRAMGYKKLITYTLPSEGGASMRASGWRLIGEAGGGNWNTKSRPRLDTPEDLRARKLRWEQP